MSTKNQLKCIEKNTHLKLINENKIFRSKSNYLRNLLLPLFIDVGFNCLTR